MMAVIVGLVNAVVRPVLATCFKRRVGYQPFLECAPNADGTSNGNIAGNTDTFTDT